MASPVIVEVELERLTYGGEAMGRLPDGRAVFVPFALPGERVRARLLEEKRGFARAALLDVLRPVPERIAPRCPHFTECGGCHYQHMPYAMQLQAKTEIVRDQFQRIAGMLHPPVKAAVPSTLEWNYRNTMQFHLSPQGKLGFQAHGGRGVVEISECHLPVDAIDTLWRQLELEPLPGIERVELRAGMDDDCLMALESREITLPEMTLDLPISVVHLSPAGSIVMAGDDYIVMEALGRPFRVSAASFFQVNSAQAEALLRHVLDIVPGDPRGTLVDVYCGVGLFTAFLAPRFAHVVGIELSESACDDFAVNLDEFDHVELYVGAAEHVLPALDVKPEVVLLDPPRAGLERAALDAVVSLAPPRLVYVSCDPATLARDTKRLLAGGYRLEQVTPFDMFPQTYHVECVAVFIKNTNIQGSFGKA